MILAPTVDLSILDHRPATESSSDGCSLAPLPPPDGTAIRFDGDLMRIHFSDFGPESYKLFLRAKRLPEFTLDFHDVDESYTVSAPRRFASMLGVEAPPAPVDDLPLLDCLLDDQCEIVRLSLDAKRFAVWSDCGGGKTLISLEYARHVIHRTGSCPCQPYSACAESDARLRPAAGDRVVSRQRSRSLLTSFAIGPRSLWDVTVFQLYVMRLEKFAVDFNVQRVNGEFDQFWAEYAGDSEVNE